MTPATPHLHLHAEEHEAGGIDELTAAGVGAAPSTADFLVGTAQAGLSAEIVVGATPGGELGGTWASPTVDATHSGSTHAATQSAAEATAAAALAGHVAAGDPHTAYVIEAATPGGELGGSYATPTVDATHSGSSHAGTQAAAEATAAAALASHEADTTNIHGIADTAAIPPNTADYLVGTANGGLTAEIVVGTSPGGELGGTWASPTVDATHSGSTHAATQAAAEATASSALTTHAGAVDPHTGYRLESAAIVEGNFGFTDITTANASATAHGLVPKWPNNTTTFFRGDGTYAVPTAALPETLQMDKTPADDATVTAGYSAMLFREYTVADGKTLTIGDGADFVIL